MCRALLTVIDAEQEGFATLRGSPAGAERWDGTVIPDGFLQCHVEGAYRFGAEYVCRGQQILGRQSAGLLEPAYQSELAAIDACLARPVLYPRQFQRGAGVRLAGGERQAVWRDSAANPAPAVALKIEEDLGSGLWFLRLAVLTMR